MIANVIRLQESKGMRSFDLLVKELSLTLSHHANYWTTYSLGDHDFERCEFDWGRSHVYHFDRGVPLAHWLNLNTWLNNWIDSQSDLTCVRVVPFYEIGNDYLVQCKPPYDGGYSTDMYAEFLDSGSCQPAPWYHQQLASLHEKVSECMNCLGHVDSSLESRIVHASLIKPNDQLFWADGDGWNLYYAEIGADDLRQPTGG